MPCLKPCHDGEVKQQQSVNPLDGHHGDSTAGLLAEKHDCAGLVAGTVWNSCIL